MANFLQRSPVVLQKTSLLNSTSCYYNELCGSTQMRAGRQATTILRPSHIFLIQTTSKSSSLEYLSYKVLTSLGLNL